MITLPRINCLYFLYPSGNCTRLPKILGLFNRTCVKCEINAKNCEICEPYSRPIAPPAPPRLRPAPLKCLMLPETTEYLGNHMPKCKPPKKYSKDDLLNVLKDSLLNYGSDTSLTSCKHPFVCSCAEEKIIKILKHHGKL